MPKLVLPGRLLMLSPLMVFTFWQCTSNNPTGTNPDVTGSLDFTSYVALGNSLTAGVSNGALYEAAQANSYPNLIARKVGITDFQQPLMSDSGFSFIPTEGRIVINPLDLTIRFSHAGIELNNNLDRAFNNLGIPRINVEQMVAATTAAEADSNHFVDKILRNHGRTVIQEALTLEPTVITLWVGNNDVLEAAAQGLAAAAYTSPAAFAAAFDTVLTQLNSRTIAPLIAANIPDITQVPYFTSLPPYVRDPDTHDKVYLYGMINGQPQQLTDDDYVLFFALPDFFALQDSINHGHFPGPEDAINDTLILDASEAADVRGVIDNYNQTLSAALAAGKIDALVDINGLFNSISTSGYTFQDGPTYSSALVGFDSTGTIQLKLATTMFSLDGLHPNNVGYAIIANAFIESLNAAFDASIPLVKLTDIL